MGIKISAILPVYNVEKYLVQCLDSLFNQTLTDFEIICVDDGSTDSSLSILQEYQKKDSRLKVLTQQNKYAGVARNYGLSIAEGEYVLFLDSDDFFENTLFEDVYNKANHTHADVVIFSGRKYDERNKCFLEAPGFLREVYIPKKDVFNRADCPQTLLLISAPAPWTKAYRREFVMNKQLQFQALQNSNDVFFTFMALCLADKITVLKKCLVNYRIGMTTNLQAVKVKNPLCFVSAFTAIFEKLNEYNVFEEVKEAFINATLFNYAYNLKTMGVYEAFKEVAYALKSENIEKMGLFNLASNRYLRLQDFDEVYSIYQIVCKNDEEKLKKTFSNQRKKTLYSRIKNKILRNPTVLKLKYKNR